MEFPTDAHAIGSFLTLKSKAVEEMLMKESDKQMIAEIEPKYRSILSNIEELYYEVDLSGNLTLSNDSMSKILGYSKDELIGMNNRQYMDEETSKKVYQTFNRVYRTGVPAKAFDWELIRKDGTRRILETSVSIMRDSEGQPRGFYGIGRDITERKRAEGELRAEKQKFQILSENAPFAMVMIDRDGTFRYINPKFTELFGYDLTDVPNGRTWFKKAYPDSFSRQDAISAWREDLKSFKVGEKRSRVFTVTCKDGTEKIINFIPVQLETGDNLMACEDITERKQAETALRESEEKYRTILNSIEEGYYEVDLAGNFTFSNDFLVKSLGYTREELEGLNNRRYMSPETAKLVFNTFNEVYRTGNTKKDFELELINKDGTKRFVEVSVSLMRDGKGKPKGFYGTAQDVTERRQAEEQERNLQRAKDKVLHHLSHELRTPVSVIQGNIRVLKRKVQKQTPPIVGEEVFDLLERNLGRLSHIQLEADEIIRFNGEMEKSPHNEALNVPPSAGVKRISLNSLAQEVLGEVKEKASHRDIQVTLEGAKGLTLDANPGVLEGMFIGLLRNAIENTPDEGVVRIVLEQKAQWLQLKFMDFGIGITKENQRRLFDGFFHTLDTEFYRSRRPYDFGAGGKGLDLLRMKVYSQRFGFDISAASQRCLYLPTDKDLCLGRISKCPHCRVRKDCFNSGGSTFSLTFLIPTPQKSEI
jgi:PAS domain S-box-containing protein